MANASPSAQGTEEQKAEAEGTVICDVRGTPYHGKLSRKPYKLYAYGTLPTNATPGREFILANVDCSLYLDPTTRTDAPANLRSAFISIRNAIT